MRIFMFERSLFFYYFEPIIGTAPFLELAYFKK